MNKCQITHAERWDYFRRRYSLLWSRLRAPLYHGERARHSLKSIYIYNIRINSAIKWNGLPEELRRIENQNTFKIKCDIF